jgi:hypothetical protein
MTTTVQVHHRRIGTRHESDGLKRFLLDVEPPVEPREADIKSARGPGLLARLALL